MPTRAQQLEAVQRLVRESVATVDAIAPEAVRVILPVLREVRDELRSDLKDWLANAPDGSERYTGYQNQQALRAIEGAIDRMRDLEPAMASALAKARHATGPLAIDNLDTEIQRLSSIFGGGMPHVPAIDTAAIIAKGDRLLWKQHERSARRYAGQTGEDIRHLFTIGVAKGETIEQTVNRLRKVGNPRARSGPVDPGAAAGEIADGLFRRHRWWAERLVRTEVMNAYNVQHDAAIDYANDHRPDGEDEFQRRWDAAADPRTCVLCSELDGTITTIGGAFKGGIKNPPRHPCCRCIVLAWLARWGGMRGETPHKGELPEPRAQETEHAGAEHHIGRGRIGVAEAEEIPIEDAPHRSFGVGIHHVRGRDEHDAIEEPEPARPASRSAAGDYQAPRQVVHYRTKTGAELEAEERARQARYRAADERFEAKAKDAREARWRDEDAVARERAKQPAEDFPAATARPAKAKGLEQGLANKLLRVIDRIRGRG